MNNLGEGISIMINFANQILKKILYLIENGYLIFISIIGLLELLLKRAYMPFFKSECDEVIILGNGPSLKNIDLAKLRDKKRIIACVNYFPIYNEDFFIIKPDFLCLFDPVFFDFIVEHNKEDNLKLLDCLEKVDWKLIILCPAGKRLHLKNNNISYSWINYNINPFPFVNKLVSFFYKKNILSYGCYNVVLGALYYFISCKYDNIYIAGVDMSDFKNLYVDNNNRVYVNTTHSYGSTRYYFDEMPEHNVFCFCEILSSYQKVFVSFDCAKKYADRMKVNVRNLSIDSYIDSFDKISPLDFSY